MSTYSLSHVADHTLLHDLAALVARDCSTTAALLAHLAEVDARQLYRPAAYPSMYAYCVGELRLSEDAACKRIRAARAAREFPALFTALADGRLHLAAVCLLAPHLTPENADVLAAAATHRSKSEVEQLLAERFPRPEVPSRVEAIAPARGPTADPWAPKPAELSAPGRIDAAEARSRVTPLAPERFALQVSIGQETHDKLRYAQALLGHAVPSGDLAQVLDRALDALIGQLEQRKCAATTRPHAQLAPGPVDPSVPRRREAAHSRRPSANPRHIPAEVRRTVWARDGGRCTFVSEAGRRCAARTRLEFDHLEPVARGGQATVSGMRLRCRAHNQLDAERTFGAAFMREKREAARCRAAAAASEREWAAAASASARDQAAAAAREQEREQERERAAAAARERDQERDVVPWLRQLGFRPDEARRAVAYCERLPDASLEERVRLALSVLTPGHRRRSHVAGATQPLRAAGLRR